MAKEPQNMRKKRKRQKQAKASQIKSCKGSQTSNTGEETWATKQEVKKSSGKSSSKKRPRPAATKEAHGAKEGFAK